MAQGSFVKKKSTNGQNQQKQKQKQPQQKKPSVGLVINPKKPMLIKKQKTQKKLSAAIGRHIESSLASKSHQIGRLSVIKKDPQVSSSQSTSLLIKKMNKK
ncbi:hypothetical protein MIR68_007828 [Amoeboaphelidium protococcarum]|nr:hypothetical protein MIR68_007828 [Amoeboaphelidium protococcarum]